MDRTPVRRATTVAALLALAASAFFVGRLLSTKGMAWAGNFGSIAAFILGAIAFLGPLLGRGLRATPPASTVTIGHAADDLAKALNRRWTEDERLRRINDPRPLPVRWTVTRLAEEVMPGIALGDSGSLGLPAASHLSGQFDAALSTLTSVSSQRLVILGAAGAGKSVLAAKMGRELLAVRSSGDPVPIILAASSWNGEDSLSDWVARQLIHNHRGLKAIVKETTGEMTSLAKSLASDSVFPIVDGFDELPSRIRGEFLKQINAAGSDRPLIITSRPDEYLAAVSEVGRAISQAIAVQLLPLRVEEVETYLSEATSAFPQSRWRKVYERLNADPAGPLAAALTTPLMLWLARTIYETSSTDPSELADNSCFSDQEAIEQHLLDAFVPSVYGGRWSPAKARRWLGLLAANFGSARRNTNFLSFDIAWWLLLKSVKWLVPLSTAIRAALFTATAWGLAVWVLWHQGMWWHGGYVRLDELDHAVLAGPLGREIQFSISAIKKFLLPAGSTPSPQARMQDAAANRELEHIVFGDILSLGSLPWFTVKISLVAAASGILRVADPILPMYTWPKKFKLKAFPAAALGVFALCVILILQISRDYTSGSSPGILFFVLLIAIFGLLWPTKEFMTYNDISDAISPLKTLRLDRRSVISIRLIRNAQITAICWLLCGTDIALACALFLIIILLSEILLGGRKSASGFYAEARILLLCSRRMPWSAMTFLIDAHQRGVLRQEGAVYQFRHVRMQQRLSADYTPWRDHFISFAADAIGSLCLRHLRRAIAAMPAEVAQVHKTTSELHFEGPGFFQHLRDTDSDLAWVICSLFLLKPVLITAPIWTELLQVGGAGNGAIERIGYPVASSRIPLARRLVGTDATAIELAGGLWGPGQLVRDHPGQSWRWEQRKVGWLRAIFNPRRVPARPYMPSQLPGTQSIDPWPDESNREE